MKDLVEGVTVEKVLVWRLCNLYVYLSYKAMCMLIEELEAW